MLKRSLLTGAALLVLPCFAGADTVRPAVGKTVLASGAEPPATQTQLVQAIAGFYYQAQDYPHAVIWVNRYIAAHGQDTRTRALLAQALAEIVRSLPAST